MIIKILKKSASFSGVSYSYNKINKLKGELMKAGNFDLLGAIKDPKPSDYRNYLVAWSSKNKRIRYPQLHAVLSCKGREKDKEQLTDMAERWLEGMGYSGQPYLLIFHNDTGNNHVHMVTSRVDKEGKKIGHAFERIRAYRVLQGLEQESSLGNAQKDLDSALAYSFSTKAQFAMLLEAKGYHIEEREDMVQILKFGSLQTEIPKAALEAKLAGYQVDQKRRSQLKAIIAKYKASYNPSLAAIYERLPGGVRGKIIGYSSELSDQLRDKFGLELLFHFSAQKLPYGYSVLDHAKKQVYKGSELLKLKDLLTVCGLAPGSGPNVPAEEKKVLDKYFNQNSANVQSDLQSPESGYGEEMDALSLAFSQMEISISDDIDDEQINGRSRRRRRKARVNTR